MSNPDLADLDIWKDPVKKIPYLTHEIHLEEEAQKRAYQPNERYADQGDYADPRFGNPEVRSSAMKQQQSLIEKEERGKKEAEEEEEEEDAEEGIEAYPQGYRKRLKEAEANTPDDHVRIIIERQVFRTLYSKSETDGIVKEQSWSGPHPSVEEEPLGIHKATLMRCSTLARDFFTWYPDAKMLHLPVRYPRRHFHGFHEEYRQEDFPRDEAYIRERHKRYYHKPDSHMAHILPAPLEDVLIPWFKQVHGAGSMTSRDAVPRPRIPPNYSLLNRIHLYNAMLQLGVPKFIQRPLTENICQDMYRARLSECHLRELENTVGRFHSLATQVTDPVLSAFIGSYGLRSLEDRNDAHLRRTPRDGHVDDGEAPEGTLQGPDPGGNRDEAPDPDQDRPGSILDYGHIPAGRAGYPRDTRTVAPALPVLGHGVKNWSGLGVTKELKVCQLGYPLHIGDMTYYKRETRKRTRDTDTGPDEASNKQKKGAKRAKARAAQLDQRPGPSSFWPESADDVEALSMSVDSAYDVLRPMIAISGPPGGGLREQ